MKHAHEITEATWRCWRLTRAPAAKQATHGVCTIRMGNLKYLTLAEMDEF